MDAGIVRAVRRQDSEVDFVIPGQLYDGVAYYGGEAPPPLSFGWFRNEGRWFYERPAAPVRQLFHDDFTIVQHKVGCDLRRATNQSLSANAMTAVTWPIEDFDSDGFYTPTGSVITIPAGLGGLYAITFQGLLTSAPSTYVEAQIVAGGVTYRPASEVDTPEIPMVSITVPLAAGDTIVVRVQQGASGSRNLNPARLYVRRVDTHGIGDTGWEIPSPIGSGPPRPNLAHPFAVPSEAEGVIRVASDHITHNVVAKTPQTLRATVDAAHWFSARARISDLVAEVEDALGVYNLGLINLSGSGPNAFVSFVFGDTNWEINQTDITGVEAAADEWIDIDIVAVADGFVAGWINGDGPYLGTTGLPTSAGSYTPMFGVSSFSLNDPEVHLDVDWCQVSVVSKFAHPDQLEPPTPEDEEVSAIAELDA